MQAAVVELPLLGVSGPLPPNLRSLLLVGDFFLGGGRAAAAAAVAAAGLFVECPSACGVEDTLSRAACQTFRGPQ
jgi:hypothetical protein